MSHFKDIIGSAERMRQMKEEANMSLQVEKLEHNMARLTIEVSAEELEKAIQKVYQKTKKQNQCSRIQKREGAPQCN